MFHVQRTRLRSIALFVLVAVLCPWLSVAHAQSDGDRAAAQALFDEAQELKEEGDYEAACKKFEASRALDPAPGTQINLADCYVRTGRTASAWVNFVEVAQAKKGDKRRAAYAKKRADELRPLLTKLRIEVADPVDGMVVKRGDEEVAAPTWGQLVPVDPRSYEISATAPGKLPWSRTVDVEGEGEEIDVEVPALVDDETEGDDDDDDGDTPVTPGGDQADGSGQVIAGGVVLGVGVVGIGLGVVFTAIAHSTYDESKDECLADEPDRCNADGVALREDAQSAQTVYAVSYAIGGAALVAGLVTMLVAPSAGESEPADEVGMALAPWAAPNGGGLQLTGHF
jgi:hypothetical protein